MSSLSDSMWDLGPLECLVVLQIRSPRLAGCGGGKISGGRLSFHNGIGGARASVSQIWVGPQSFRKGACSVRSVLPR